MTNEQREIHRKKRIAVPRVSRRGGQGDGTICSDRCRQKAYRRRRAMLAKWRDASYAT
jgi:hypothetical protein